MTLRRWTVPGLVLAVLAIGCGEKISIPESVGLFSTAIYQEAAVYPEPDARQVLAVQGNIFVLTADSLAKRDQNYTLINGLGGLQDPRAICSDDADSLVFIWDQGLGRVSWYHASDLSVQIGLPNTADLPEVGTCTGLATCRAGIEQVPGAATFLYLSDPENGVVRRYAYEPFTGLIPHGILSRADGEGTRFVHQAAGLARDAADSLLVCDRDTLRNWVIRFDSVPDESDEDLRGHAALFDVATCNPAAAVDYVLGDAAECNETDWIGGRSDAESEFDTPTAVAVDGRGRIYVSDTGNDRIQIFTSDGYYDVLFGTEDWVPAPGSLAVIDVRTGAGPEDIDYGAYIFAVTEGMVRKYISGEHFNEISTNNPPPES